MCSILDTPPQIIERVDFMYELKKCPFCGGEATIEKCHRAFIKGVSTRVAFVHCKKCNARTGRFKLEDYNCTSHSSVAVQKAVESWNERSPL